MFGVEGREALRDEDERSVSSKGSGAAMRRDDDDGSVSSKTSGARMDNQEFNALLARARAGDDDATATLLQAFEADVRLMVRHQLPRLLRSQFDSMDFVQAVWQSVFAGGGSNAEFDGSGHFRGYLAGVARNKVFEEYRRRTTKKFDLGREEPLFVRKGGHEAPRPLASHDPSPSKWVEADECWTQLVTGGPARTGEVMALRRQGLKFVEIAERMGVSERAVRRLIEDARKRLEGE